MDSCQLIRKETKMEVVHLNQKQLAARWHLSEACLERWRSEGIGPKFMKMKGCQRRLNSDPLCPEIVGLKLTPLRT